tara:strand:+ start:196 stop:315 length:120 start_codon:yes stop_codon:yes gene_type:complete
VEVQLEVLVLPNQLLVKMVDLVVVEQMVHNQVVQVILLP